MSKTSDSVPPKSPVRGESDALVRRTRYTLRTLVLGIAVTAGVVFALILGQRWGVRLDFTATREHTLSPRTVGILKALPEPTAIVVSADVSKVDPRSWERVGDMLGEFGRTGGNAKVTLIDTGRAEASDRAGAVVAELVARDGAVIERHRTVLRDVAAALVAAAPELSIVAEQVARRAETVPDAAAKEKLLQLAAALRVAAKDAPDAAERVRAATGEEGKALPEADTAAQGAAPLMLAALKALDEASAVQPPIAGLGAVRDRIAVANDSLRSLRPLETLSVSRALRERPTVIVYNSRSTAAIDFDTLFPRSSTVPGAAAQPLFVGEEMLGTALASLGVKRPPVLVLVHGERERVLDDSGRPLPNTSNAVGKLLERLSQRRVDIAEWAVAVDPARPVLTKIDPSSDRPKVWFVLPAPPRTSADPRRSSSLADRPQRVQRLADALRSLLDSGDQVLLALEPSEMPAVGEPDPMCEPLKGWGIKPDTARPLLERIGTPRGPAISAYQTLRASEPGTPLGDALSGLSLILHWPMAVEIETVPGVWAHPVFVVPTSTTAWGESSWLPLRYANVRQPFQALMPPELPAPDAGRDRVGTAGGWPVVVTVERDRTGGAAPQRLIVVSAPGWFEDLYTQAAGTVDGRRVWAFPGNGELFEASFHWLAGLDELIAPSPRIRDVPRIEPMTEARLGAIRWTLIAGLPLLVLALGFAVRVLRG
jgi:hypothetical protein